MKTLDHIEVMMALFVHGMGRTSVSGWLMLRQFRRAGLGTATFGYSAIRESFNQIAGRLCTRLAAILANEEEVVLVGHSLGGVLLREALAVLKPTDRRPLHLFLLGSPVRPSRMAMRLSQNLLFRAATTDCGQLLASSARMSAVRPPSLPTTGIAGTRSIVGLHGAFAHEPNDGVVSLSEVSADWLTEQVLVPVIHPLLPSSRCVATVVLERLQRHETFVNH